MGLFRIADFARLVRPRWYALLAVSVCAFGQAAQPVPPDCGPWLLQTSTAASSTVVLNGAGDNRTLGCTTWTVRYASTGFTGLTVTFQAAPGSTAIGSWATYPGTTVTGSNPMTNTVGAESTFSNPTTGAVSFVRLTVSGLTGSGTITAEVYGYRTGPSGGGGGGGGGGCNNPCVVIGPEAPGATASSDPVQSSGVDGSGNVVRPLFDTTGRALTQGGNAVGAALNSNPFVSAALTGGATGGLVANSYACDSVATVNLSSMGTTQVIALSSGRRIRICGVFLTTANTVDLQFYYGTGSNCGTGTTALGGVFQDVLTLALDKQSLEGFWPPVSNALCLNLGAAIQVDGTITYAQY